MDPVTNEPTEEVTGTPVATPVEGEETAEPVVEEGEADASAPQVEPQSN